MWATTVTLIGMMLIYARAKARRERDLEQQLQGQERAYRERLETEVQVRTREVQEALVAANEASKAKTHFLARISHDLRSPLTAIIGYAQLLQAEGGKAGNQAGIIRRSGEHMLKLINELIDYARGSSREGLELTPSYLHGLLDSIAQEAKILSRQKHNRFVLRIADELPPVVLIDAQRLRQVLVNLIDNAAKFTREGTIELTTGCTRLTGAHVRLQFAVRDTGCGIPHAEQRRVFEPFYRASGGHPVQGSGLGLTIVEVWIRQMQGDLALDSSPGLGTTVRFSIPVEISHEHDMEATQMIETAEILPRLDGCGRHVWVIEDNEEIRQLLLDELRGSGFSVDHAGDGSEFIARMQSEPPPDLVLTDYLMAGADGAAVLAAVRRHWPGVPVALLSATQNTMQSLGVRLEQGFDASLTKPVNLAELRTTVATLTGLALHSRHELPDEEADGALVLPPAAELTRMQALLDMGAITELREWAQSLQQAPEHAEFARRVLELTAAWDVDGLRRLCSQDAGMAAA
jgi:signal transduction histidine kinase/CheY-like chemotaxis protein